MDRTRPSEGRDAGSIPAESTNTKRPAYQPGLFVFLVLESNERKGSEYMKNRGFFKAAKRRVRFP
jgi:hypothetical protein